MPAPITERVHIGAAAGSRVRKRSSTGGDSGIGRAVALAFAREGADVLISHLASEQDDAEETLRLVHDAGRIGVSVPGDLREEDQCRRVVRDHFRSVSADPIPSFLATACIAAHSES